MPSLRLSLNLRHRLDLIFRNMSLVVAFSAMRIFGVGATHAGFCHDQCLLILQIYIRCEESHILTKSGGADLYIGGFTVSMAEQHNSMHFSLLPDNHSTQHLEYL